MSPSPPNDNAVRLDLSRWRCAPNVLLGVGGVLALIGAFVNFKQFSYSWLLAFMFYLSLSLGALFLVLMHHLFDAGWSVPIRRFLEHIACLLFPWLALLFIPILLNTLFANPSHIIYPWMASNPHTDHALNAKQPLFTKPMFYLVSAVCFAVWGVLSWKLRDWSLKQDRTGAVRCTRRMRLHSGWGIFAYAFTLTIASILWMQSLEYHWFSTMYGVYYFADSVWLAIAVAYLITMTLQRTGTLKEVLHEHQFYFLGSLLLAFTVFYAYIHFSQYFIIWNGNMPEETFWYLQREKGSWWSLGMVVVFGHFFVPFVALLRIDAKVTFWWMAPVCLWAVLMRFCDLSFNIMPVLHPDNFVLHWIDLACMAFMGGLLAKVFLKNYAAHAPYPVRDPRLIEAAGFYHPIPTQISGGELDETDELRDGTRDMEGAH